MSNKEKDMKASYEFLLLDEDRYRNTLAAVVVLAGSLKEAEELAESLIGKQFKKYSLGKVVDSRLMIQYQEINERKIFIETHESSVKVEHSGEITEFKVQGGKEANE